MEHDDDFSIIPPVDEQGRYVITDEPGTTTPGFGRLLPLLNIFRLDKRYELTERNHPPGSSQLGYTALKSITVQGPWAPTDLVNLFVLPSDLAFRRLDEYTLVIRDPDQEPNSYLMSEIEIIFRPPRTKWWQSRRIWD